MSRAAAVAALDHAERRTGPDRRMPVRAQAIVFDWEGETWHADMVMTAPSRQVDALLNAGGDIEAYKAALSAVVRAWDFVDAEGEPIPVPGELTPVPGAGAVPGEEDVDADGVPVPVMREAGIGPVPWPLLRALVGAYLDALAAPKD